MSWKNASALLLMAVISMVWSPLSSTAADFPEEPVSWIVPFSAGGGSDRWVRALSSVGYDVMGQPIKVVNRPGQSAIAGWRYLLDQEADGHTWMLSSPTPVISLLREPQPPFPPDQVKVASFVSGFRVILMAQPDQEWSTWDGFVDYAKANPGKLVYMSTGSERIASILAMMGAGLVPNEDVTLVQVDSTSDAVTALIQGEAQIIAATESTALNYAPNDATALLNATTMPLSDEVSEKLGNPPHAVELGYKTLNFPRWVGVHPDTPDDVVAKIDEKVGAMLENESLQGLVGKMGEEVIYVSRDEAQAQFSTMVETMREVIDTLK